MTHLWLGHARGTLYPHENLPTTKILMWLCANIFCAPFVAKQIRALKFQLRPDIRHGLYTKANDCDTLPLAWPREAKYGNLVSPAEFSGEG